MQTHDFIVVQSFKLRPLPRAPTHGLLAFILRFSISAPQKPVQPRFFDGSITQMEP